MAADKSLTSRRGLGGFIALIGAAAMIVAVFLPWFGGEFTGDEAITGWDSVNPAIGEVSDYGEFVDIISGAGNFFETPYFAADGFSPFFTGLSILIAGGLLGLISLAMLASLRGGAFRLPFAGMLALAVLGILIAIVGVTNLASLYATGPGSEFLSPDYGLFILTAGALLGFIGVVGGVARGDT